MQKLCLSLSSSVRVLKQRKKENYAFALATCVDGNTVERFENMLKRYMPKSISSSMHSSARRHIDVLENNNKLHPNQNERTKNERILCINAEHGHWTLLFTKRRSIYFFRFLFVPAGLVSCYHCRFFFCILFSSIIALALFSQKCVVCTMTKVCNTSDGWNKKK